MLNDSPQTPWNLSTIKVMVQRENVDVPSSTICPHRSMYAYNSQEFLQHIVWNIRGTMINKTFNGWEGWNKLAL